MSDVGLLFPGQGAQHVGMGKEFAGNSNSCRELYNQASEVLGYDLAQLSFEGPIEELTKSVHAQPAIFVSSVAAYTVLKEKQPDLSATAMAGLSSGEWTALHLAGVLSYDDTLKVLDARGRLMQEACESHPGSMLTIMGASEEQLQEVCAASRAEMANLNSRAQTVLSGAVEWIDAAEAKAKEIGLRKVIRLNVAGAFHSSLMKDAADAFAAALSGFEFKAPSIPVLANVTGRPHESDGDSIRKAMVEQVYNSVHWYEGVEWMIGQGITSFVECGPGKVLSGLAKRIDKTCAVRNIGELKDLDQE